MSLPGRTADSDPKGDAIADLISRLPDDLLQLISNKVDSLKKKRKQKAIGSKAARPVVMPEGAEHKLSPGASSPVVYPTISLSATTAPIIFKGCIPHVTSYISIDCEGLTLVTGKRRAATIAIVGPGPKTENIFSAYIYHKADEVDDYQTRATGVTHERIAGAAVSLDWLKQFLLSVILRERPFIIGSGLQNEWEMLDLGFGRLLDHYGIEFDEKVIDLQHLFKRRDGSPINLGILCEIFAEEVKFKLDHTQTHHAIDDAKAAMCLYFNVWRKRETIRDFTGRVMDARGRTKAEKMIEAEKYRKKKK